MRQWGAVVALAALWTTGVAAVPRVLRVCETATDCAVVTANCLPPVAVSKSMQVDVEASYQSMGTGIECRPPTEGRGARPKAKTSCRGGLCTLGGVEKEKACDVAPVVAATGDHEVDALVARLRLPVAHAVAMALDRLKARGAAGKVAAPVYAWLWNLSKTPNERYTDCFLGYPNFKEAVLAVLTAVGPALPLQEYAVAAYKARAGRDEQHELSLLHYFTALGAGAAAIAPDVLAALRDDHQGHSTRPAEIAVLAVVPSLAPESMPVLKDIATTKSDQDNVAAMRALTALGGAKALADVDLLATLTEPQGDYDRKVLLLQAVPADCPTAERCAELIAPLVRGGSAEVIGEAALALARLGPSGVGAIGDLLELYYRGKWSFSAHGVTYHMQDLALAALAAVDPTGSRILPLVKKHLKSPFKVRDTVLLLEHLQSGEARRLAAKARKLWGLN